MVAALMRPTVPHVAPSAPDITGAMSAAWAQTVVLSVWTMSGMTWIPARPHGPSQRMWRGQIVALARCQPESGGTGHPKHWAHCRPGKPTVPALTAEKGTSRWRRMSRTAIRGGLTSVRSAASAGRSARSLCWSLSTRRPAMGRTCASSKRSSTSPCRRLGCWARSSSWASSATSRSSLISTRTSWRYSRKRSIRPLTRYDTVCSEGARLGRQE